MSSFYLAVEITLICGGLAVLIRRKTINAFNLRENMEFQPKTPRRDQSRYSRFDTSSGFAMTQMAAIVIAIMTLCGELNAADGIFRIVVCMIICAVGVFASNYLSQLSTMKAGLYMVADKRVSLGNLLKQAYLGYFKSTSAGKNQRCSDYNSFRH